MNKALFVVVLLAATAMVWAQSTTKPSTQPAAAAPINKMCPINIADAVDPKVTIVYKGKTIGFCCSDCIELFEKDPEKYMKDLK